MQLPFDQSKLDKLLDDHGIDFLIINVKNTAQYLLGGYKFFFFAQKDSIGISRYLPTIGYPKGRPEMAFYIGHMLEGQQQEVEPLWIKDIKNIQWNTSQAGHEAAKKVIELGYSKKMDTSLITDLLSFTILRLQRKFSMPWALMRTKSLD